MRVEVIVCYISIVFLTLSVGVSMAPWSWQCNECMTIAPSFSRAEVRTAVGSRRRIQPVSHGQDVAGQRERLIT